MSADRVHERLREGDTVWLLDIPPERLPEARLLGPGAAYYLSLQYDRLGMKERSAELLELQLRERTYPWSQESAVRLAERLMEEELYEEAESRLRRLKERDPYYRAVLSFQRQKALYWQEKDEEVLRRAGELPDAEGFSLLEADRRAELDLFRAVSSHRLGSAEWPRLFVSLFVDHPQAEVHVRALRYLRYYPSALGELLPVERALLEGKGALAEGRRSEGIDLIEEYFGDVEPEALRESPLVRELGFAYLYSEQYERGALFLEELSSRLSLVKRLEAQEMAGRLHRKAGNGDLASELLAKTALATADPDQRDRCLWYRLDIRMADSVQAAFEDLRRFGGLWGDPEYFDDLLDELVTGLLAERKTDRLVELAFLLEDNASAPLRSRLQYILLRLGKGEADSGAGNGPAWSGAAEMYYGLLLSAAGASVYDPLDSLSPPASADAIDPFVAGFFRFGLYREGYEAVRSREAAAQGTLKYAARQMADAGFTAEGMRLMGLALIQENVPPSPSEARVLYPEGFAELIDPLAIEEELPRHLLYSLVREESYFDPEIRSSAGAVGLTQLMEATASDMARLLRIENPRLTDPQTNLRLGFHHFGRLYRRLESVPKSLMAFNAGLSRVRSWEIRYAEFPPDLLVEVLPYPETRHYVRKILVSSVLYARLYSDTDAGNILRLFYPDLPLMTEPMRGVRIEG